MKNITLSIPEDLLRKGRQYAKQHGTSLNEMIRQLLRKTIDSGDSDFVKRIEDRLQDLGVDTRDKFSREDIYER